MIATLAAAALLAADPKAYVHVFVMEGCPIARKYAPEVQRIFEDYQPKGVEFTLVMVDPKLTTEAAEAWKRDFGLGMDYVLDPRQKIAKRDGVTNVPSVAVYEKSKLVYVGRIDDRFPALGVDRKTPHRRDLRVALDEVLGGKPVSVKRTQTIGCLMPTL
jgi:hypothetical protein